MKKKMFNLKKMSLALVLIAAVTLSFNGFAENNGGTNANKGNVRKTVPPTTYTYYLLRWRPLPPMVDIIYTESSWLASQLPVSYANYTLTSFMSPASYRGWLAFPSDACRSEFLNKRVHPTGATYTYSKYYEVDWSHNTLITNSPNVLLLACSGLEVEL
jgi:hypothetical protein